MKKAPAGKQKLAFYDIKRMTKAKKSTVAKEQKEHVLIVDDDPDMCLFLTESLNGADIPCISAKSIIEANTILDSKRISLVIVDWGLRGHGDTSGSQVLAYCKKKFPLMPVIITSGQPFDWQTDAILNEANGCLEKPFSATVLIGIVREWLKIISLTKDFLLPQNENQIVPLEKVKKYYIKHVVKLLGGNVSEAAIKLGIHRQTVAAAMEEND